MEGSCCLRKVEFKGVLFHFNLSWLSGNAMVKPKAFYWLARLEDVQVNIAMACSKFNNNGLE